MNKYTHIWIYIIHINMRSSRQCGRGDMEMNNNGENIVLSSRWLRNKQSPHLTSQNFLGKHSFVNWNYPSTAEELAAKKSQGQSMNILKTLTIWARFFCQPLCCCPGVGVAMVRYLWLPGALSCPPQKDPGSDKAPLRKWVDGLRRISLGRCLGPTAVL